ncbi:TetR/AcrR family transcriptional regulator [Pseudonocardia pini]|uniref:TetR/AcrR family transcriptional regulator n=1 Tax=Pseudonocardia pini TaxID=2758030 RepID=UPI0015F0B833|nr:TetR/AcrR family transcriptional regulator [Pseudonocardia pini]
MSTQAVPPPDESLLARAARRRTGDRLAAAEDEVRRLLDVGLELMRENPGDSPRIADIVRRAGVSNDAFYRAFRSKDDLMAAIADDGSRRLVDYLRHQRDKQSDPAAQVEAVARGVLAQAGDREVAVATRAVLRNVGRAPRSGGGALEVRSRIADLLEPALTALGSPDPVRDALMASCGMFALMEQFLWEEREPDEADVDHLVGWVTAAAGR